MSGSRRMQARVSSPNVFNHSTPFINGSVEVEVYFLDKEFNLKEERIWVVEPTKTSNIWGESVKRNSGGGLMSSRYAPVNVMDQKRSWLLEDIGNHELKAEKQAYDHRMALEMQEHKKTALKFLHAAQTARHPFDIYRNIKRVSRFIQKPINGEPGYLPEGIENECARELEERTSQLMHFKFEHPDENCDHLDPVCAPIETMKFKNLPDEVPGAVYKLLSPLSAEAKSFKPTEPSPAGKEGIKSTSLDLSPTATAPPLEKLPILSEPNDESSKAVKDFSNETASASKSLAMAELTKLNPLALDGSNSEKSCVTGVSGKTAKVALMPRGRLASQEEFLAALQKKFAPARANKNTAPTLPPVSSGVKEPIAKESIEIKSVGNDAVAVQAIGLTELTPSEPIEIKSVGNDAVAAQATEPTELIANESAEIKSIGNGAVIAQETESTELIAKEPNEIKSVGNGAVVAQETEFTELIGKEPNEIKLVGNDAIAAQATEPTELIANEPVEIKSAENDAVAAQATEPTEIEGFGGRAMLVANVLSSPVKLPCSPPPPVHKVVPTVVKPGCSISSVADTTHSPQNSKPIMPATPATSNSKGKVALEQVPSTAIADFDIWMSKAKPFSFRKKYIGSQSSAKKAVQENPSVVGTPTEAKEISKICDKLTPSGSPKQISATCEKHLPSGSLCELKLKLKQISETCDKLTSSGSPKQISETCEKYSPSGSLFGLGFKQISETYDKLTPSGSLSVNDAGSPDDNFNNPIEPVTPVPLRSSALLSTDEFNLNDLKKVEPWVIESSKLPRIVVDINNPKFVKQGLTVAASQFVEYKHPVTLSSFDDAVHPERQRTQTSEIEAVMHARARKMQAMGEQERKVKGDTTSRSQKDGIYLRPAVDADMHGVARVYNFHVRNGVSTEDFEEVTTEDMSCLLSTCREERMPFIVAIAGDVSDSPTPGNKEKIVGFTYAQLVSQGIRGLSRSSNRSRTAKISVYVDGKYLRKKIGTRLLKHIHTISSVLSLYKLIINIYCRRPSGPDTHDFVEDENLIRLKHWLQKLDYKQSARFPQAGRDDETNRHVDTIVMVRNNES